MGHENVRLYAGKEKKHFMVHKNLLVSKSEYFKGEVANTSSDSDSVDLNVETFDSAAVALMVGFLYHGGYQPRNEECSMMLHSRLAERLLEQLGSQGHLLLLSVVHRMFHSYPLLKQSQILPSAGSTASNISASKVFISCFLTRATQVVRLQARPSVCRICSR